MLNENETKAKYLAFLYAILAKEIDGYVKVLEGVTSLDEVIRVAQY
jgi:hypothetical protein